MSSKSEEQTPINLATANEGESKLTYGHVDSDVEIGNIQDPVQFLLHSEQNYTNIISPSIQMTPSRIRDLNPRVFNPRQVSIGPLHRQDKNVQAFEGKKAIFLHDLLHHSSLQREQTLERCVQKVKASICKIKACYGDGIEGYSDDEIIKMMVMDGCFVLEFIYKRFMDLFDEDLVIEPISMAYDLVLIENQIPFFVLEHIFQCTSPRFKPKVTSLSKLIIRGLIPAIIFFESQYKIKDNEVSNKTHYHILSFIHDFYRPLDAEIRRLSNLPKDKETNWSNSERDVEINQTSDLERSYSALELNRAGVKFRPHRQPRDLQWPMDIKLELPRFSRYRPWARPTLRMPVLGIHNFTELVCRNLIAYEQLSPRRVCHYVTSYVIAIDILIDNLEDVARLVKSKVITNTIGSNEEAAKLINDMRKEICCPDLLYINLWKEMNRYHERFWPRNIAWFRRTYFSNPWSIIALFAGIFLFLFAMVQTYFTINPV